MTPMLSRSATLAALAGAVGMIAAGTAAADVDVYLAAGRFMKPINGENVPMWGYKTFDPLNPPERCNQVNNEPDLQSPGPEITASAGDTLIIHLINCIPARDNEVADRRTSVMIPGQPTPTVDDPNRGIVGASGPEFYPGGNANFAGRMRSQVPAALPFNPNIPRIDPVVYTFDTLRAGTFIYHSGTHMQVQVQMGLHGALTVCPGSYNETQKRCTALNRPYADAKGGYFREIGLFYSEIDTDIHRSVDASCYGPAGDGDRWCTNPSLRLTSTIDYAPRYLLINGEPFDGQKLDVEAAIEDQDNGIADFPNAGRKVLVRVRSAGNRYHAIACKICGNARAIAEDGYVYTYRQPGGTDVTFERQQETFLVSPLQTRDLFINSIDPDNGGTLYGFQLMLDIDRVGEIPPVAAVTP